LRLDGLAEVCCLCMPSSYTNDGLVCCWFELLCHRFNVFVIKLYQTVTTVISNSLTKKLQTDFGIAVVLY